MIWTIFRFVLVWVVILVVGLELGSRGLSLLLPGLADLKSRHLYDFEKAHPFFGMQLTGRTRTTDGLSLEDTGGECLSYVPGDGECRVMLLGGSTCYGEPLQDNELRLPRRVSYHLNQTLKDNPIPRISRFTVINAASPSYQTRQGAAVMWSLMKYHPRVILTLDGFNDLARALENGAYGLPCDYPGWPWIVLKIESSALLRFSLWLVDEIQDWWVYQHSVFCRIVLNLTVSRLSRWGAAIDEDNIEEKVQRYSLVERREWIKAGVQSYENNLRYMNRLARSCGIHFVTVLQPLMGYPEILSDSQREYLGRREYYDLLLAPAEEWFKGYDLLLQVGDRLCSEGVNWIDGTDMFGDEAPGLMHDLMHAKARGQDIMARFLAVQIISVLERSSDK